MKLAALTSTLVATSLACGSQEEQVTVAPPSSELNSLILEIVEGDQTVAAQAYDLRGAEPDPLELTVRSKPETRVRAHYLRQTLDVFGLMPGRVELFSSADPQSLEILPEEQFEAALSVGSSPSWELKPSAELIRVRTPHEFASLELTVRGFKGNNHISGVEVCVKDDPRRCAESTEGVAKLTKLLRGQRQVLTLKDEGRMPIALMVAPLEEANSIGGAVFMMDLNDLREYAEISGASFDIARFGAVDFVAYDSQLVPVSSVQGSLTPPRGRFHGHFAGGVLLDVEPGEYTIIFEHDPSQFQFCGPSSISQGWISSQGDRADLEVFAGYITHIQSIVCL